MSDLFKLLARNLVLGTLAGWISLTALIISNTAGLYELVFTSSNPLLPLILLAFGFTLTFGSLAMGAAVMMLPYDRGAGNDRGMKMPTLLAHWSEQLQNKQRARVLVPVRIQDKQNPPRNL